MGIHHVVIHEKAPTCAVHLRENRARLLEKIRYVDALYRNKNSDFQKIFSPEKFSAHASLFSPGSFLTRRRSVLERILLKLAEEFLPYAKLMNPEGFCAEIRRP